MKKKKSNKIKVGKKSIDIQISIDLDSALGLGARLAYLMQNPHGFAAVTKKHKNKKKYNRKSKLKDNV